MSNLHCPIAEVLFPQVRAKVLELLFTKPLRYRYVRELASLTGLALHTIQDELRKLTAIGLVKTWSNGYHRFYAADNRHPLFPSLTEIVRLSTKLPNTAHAALRRPVRRKPRRVALRHLPSDRQPNWGLFRHRSS